MIRAVRPALDSSEAMRPDATTRRRRGRHSRYRTRDLLVVHPGAELYGADRMLLASVGGFVAAGRSVTVALPDDGPLAGEIEALGAQVVYIRMPVLRRNAVRPAGFLRLVKDVAAGVRPAVRSIRATRAVYVNTVTLPSWVLLARFLRRPVTCHVHEAEQSAPRLLRRVLALPAACADQVIVNSTFTRAVLEQVAPRAARRSVLVHNGVPGPGVMNPPRAALPGAARLIYVGRLSPRKGPQVAVAAVGLLVCRGIDVRLDIVGSVFPGYEWFEDELREEIERSELVDRVRLAGFRSDIWPELAAADIALVPSIMEESFGNAAVEAVLAARPVVVSGIGGLREAVAGFSSVQTVAPGSAGEIADAVERVIAGWARFAAEAVEDSRRAAERYAPARYGERIADLLGPPGRSVRR